MANLLPVLLALVLVAPNALAAGRDLAPRPLGPSAYAQQTPLVAYAGGRYLTVWLESLDRAGWRYLGAFSDAAGTRLSPSAFVVVPYGIAGPAQLLGTGDSFALFFPLDDGVQMMDIDLAGRVTATRVIPVENFRYDPAVAWNGTHFVVTEKTQAVFFDRAGTIARKVPLPCRPMRHDLVAVRTDVIVASACEGGGLRADFLASDGSILTTMLDPSFNEIGIRVAAAPAAGDATLIAWGSSQPEQSLKTATVSATGVVSSPKTVAHGGGQAFEPLIITTTPDGFLLPYMIFGALRVATLSGDGAPVAIYEEPPTSFGWPARAASDGTHVVIADIQYESQISRGRVRTRLVDTDAQVATTGILSIVPARQLAPAIGVGSGSLVAAWTEKQGTTSAVKAARIAPDGTPLANAVIDPDGVLASDDLAWNGAEYLTVILRNDLLLAQRIDAFGERAGTPKRLSSFPGNVTPHVAVVWSGDRWDVVWTDSVIAYHAEVASDGTVSSVEPVKLEGTLADNQYERAGIYDVALAYDGERVLLAWIEGQYYPCPFECIQNRPAFLTTIDRFAFQVGAPHRISDPWEISESVSLATNGREVVALTTRYHEKAVTTSLDTTLQRIASRTFDGAGDVTWDGSAFVLALRERQQLTVRRLDANLRDAARPRVAHIAPADVDDSLPSIAVAISGNAIIGIQECDASGGRAVGYVEQELGYEPQRRRIVRR